MNFPKTSTVCLNKARMVHIPLPALLLLFFTATMVFPVVSHPKQFFLSDEGKATIHYVDLDNPAATWSTKSPSGSIRDLQLVGDNRVLLGVGDGFAEFDVTTGALLDHKKVYSGVGAVRRLPNGNTVLAKKDNSTLLVVDPDGNEVNKIQLEKSSHRLLRVTSKGTFIYGNGGDVIEADESGKMIWSASVRDAEAKEVYAAVRESDDCVWVTTGYDNSLLRIDGEKNITKFTASTEHGSYEFAGFQVLPGGKVVVANWQGHGDGNGNKGHQIMQFDTATKKVDWYWEQDAELISSINNILVVDGLDASVLHTDGEGIMKPVSGTPVRRGSIERRCGLTIFRRKSVKSMVVQPHAPNGVEIQFNLLGSRTAPHSSVHTPGLFIVTSY